MTPFPYNRTAARRGVRRVVLLTLALGLASCATAGTVGEAVGVIGRGEGTGTATSWSVPGGRSGPGAAGAVTTSSAPTVSESDGAGTAPDGTAGREAAAAGTAIDPGTSAVQSTGPADGASQAGAASVQGAAPQDGTAPAAALATSTAPLPVTDPNVGGAPCTVGPVPRSLGLHRFYRQACVVDGLAVVASAEVDATALVAAATVVRSMLSARPDLVAQMAERHFRLGVIGVAERAVDLPEYRDLPTNYPKTDWDAARAYGATPRRPLAAAPEENLLCTARDTYPGQSVLTHELGHSVLDMAVLPGDPRFDDKVEAAFKAASVLDVYQNTYAMTNADEYWAEGVQDFFDASRAGYGPNGGGDGYDSPIHSRDTLRRSDPTLYALIAQVFTEVAWQPRCPTA